MIASYLLWGFYFLQKGILESEAQNIEEATTPKFKVVFLPSSSQNDPKLGANCRNFLESCESVLERGFCQFSYYRRYCCQTCTRAHVTTPTHTSAVISNSKPLNPLRFDPDGRSMISHAIGFDPSNSFDGKIPTVEPVANRQKLFLPNRGPSEEEEEGPKVNDVEPSSSDQTTTPNSSMFTTTVSSDDDGISSVEDSSDVAIVDMVKGGSSTPPTGSNKDDEIPRECLTSSGEVGVCKILKHCPPVIEAIASGSEYILCGFQGGDPIACCPHFVTYHNVPGCGERKILHTEEKSSSSVLESGSSEAESDDKRILGGEISQTNSWPWMAILGYKNPSGISAFCSGVIISDRFILTAAHCVLEPEPFLVRLGEHDYLATNETFPPQDVEVEDVFFYPDYHLVEGYHDLALVKLAHKVNIDREHIRAVCLPWGLESPSGLVGRSTVVTGWGVEQYGGAPSSALREVLVQVFPAERCQESYSTLDDFKSQWPRGMTQDHVICAGTHEGGKDACQGDSGGPMVRADYKSVYTLYGIVSKGYGCGLATFPGIYAPIPNRDHLKWIKAIVFQSSNIGNKIQ